MVSLEEDREIATCSGDIPFRPKTEPTASGSAVSIVLVSIKHFVSSHKERNTYKYAVVYGREKEKTEILSMQLSEYPNWISTERCGQDLDDISDQGSQGNHGCTTFTLSGRLGTWPPGLHEPW